jgi:hypothetical protein
MVRSTQCSFALLIASQHVGGVMAFAAAPFPVPDMMQSICLDNANKTTPLKGAVYFGQDAQYMGLLPSFTESGDDTVTDNVPRLIWAKMSSFNSDSRIKADDKSNHKAALTALLSQTRLRSANQTTHDLRPEDPP